MDITRRTFLHASATTAAGFTLVLTHLRPEAILGSKASAASGAAQALAYGDWRDVYRERWRWDKVVKSTHFVNCWYQAHCCWNVFVKDGIVWREEQVAQYPQTNDFVPDPNPRGCQKGCCYTRMRISAQSDQSFRFKVITHFGIVITHFGQSDQAVLLRF